MGKGFLRIELFASDHALPVASEDVRIKKNGVTLYTLKTDQNGWTQEVELEAPDIPKPDTSLADPPYAVYDVEISAGSAYKRKIIHDVQIYDGITSILPVQMYPAVANAPDGNVDEIFIPRPHGVDIDRTLTDDAFYANDDPACAVPYQMPAQGGAVGYADVVQGNDIAIPEYITVHLGSPNATATNVRVPFRDYVKNVASSEIYPTWEDAALRANIMCQISLVLNRIYTTWYRSRGKNFDITNDTQFDQYFVNGREIYQNISRIVDDIFNNFLRRQGFAEPFYAEYCDGRQSQCPGLKQWGSQDLALRGYTPIRILRYYYPDDIQIVQTDRLFSNAVSYVGMFPGASLSQGSSGANVRLMQMYLNRISGDWYIPSIANPNGVFGADTRTTVIEFQRIFNLLADGIIGRSTWYEIIRVYVAAKKLAQLVSEGERISIGPNPPTSTIRQGDKGEDVVQLQFLLAFISEYFPTIPLTIQSGVFRPNTREAVVAFQRQYNLTADGIVGPTTWRRLYEVYKSIRDDLPAPPTTGIPAFPGTALRQGSRGDDVLLMQTYLNAIARSRPTIPTLVADGIFGPATQAAVVAFQNLFGLTADGIIGHNTWYRIIDVRNNLSDPGPGPGPGVTPPYPGTALRVGSRGSDVQLVQNRLNTIRRVFPAIPQLVADGVFGANTQTAVIAFQRIFGLTPDGVVGPATWNALMNAATNLPNGSPPAFPGTLRVGSSGGNVSTIQRYLNTIATRYSSIPTLTVDGSFGPRTQQSVIAFQRLFGLTADGVVGPLTWNMIMSVYNAVNMRAASPFEDGAACGCGCPSYGVPYETGYQPGYDLPYDTTNDVGEVWGYDVRYDNRSSSGYGARHDDRYGTVNRMGYVTGRISSGYGYGYGYGAGCGSGYDMQRPSGWASHYGEGCMPPSPPSCHENDCGGGYAPDCDAGHADTVWPDFDHGYDREPCHDHDKKPCHDHDHGYDREPCHDHDHGYDREPCHDHDHGYDREPCHCHEPGYANKNGLWRPAGMRRPRPWQFRGRRW